MALAAKNGITNPQLFAKIAFFSFADPVVKINITFHRNTPHIIKTYNILVLFLLSLICIRKGKF